MPLLKYKRFFSKESPVELIILSLYKYIEEDCGYKIAIAEREVEAIISTKELEEQLNLNKKEPILYIKQVSRFDNGDIFEYSHTYHYGYTLTLSAVTK